MLLQTSHRPKKQNFIKVYFWFWPITKRFVSSFSWEMPSWHMQTLGREQIHIDKNLKAGKNTFKQIYFWSKCNEDCNFTILNSGYFSLKFFKFPIIKFHSLHKKTGCFASGAKCSDRVHRKKTTKSFFFFKLESFLSVVNKKTIKLSKTTKPA